MVFLCCQRFPLHFDRIYDVSDVSCATYLMIIGGWYDSMAARADLESNVR